VVVVSKGPMFYSLVGPLHQKSALIRHQHFQSLIMPYLDGFQLSERILDIDINVKICFMQQEKLIVML